MARQLAGQAEIVGVAGRDTVEEFGGFVDRHDLGHVTHVADVDGTVWQRFGISGQPAWVFVDGETGSAETVFGALGADRLTRMIEDLAAEA